MTWRQTHEVLSDADSTCVQNITSEDVEDVEILPSYKLHPCLLPLHLVLEP